MSSYSLKQRVCYVHFSHWQVQVTLYNVKYFVMYIILIVMGNCHYFVSNGKCIWFLIHSVMYKRSCVMSNSKYVNHIFILLSVNVIVLPQTVSLLGTFFTSLCSNAIVLCTIVRLLGAVFCVEGTNVFDRAEVFFSI